MKRIKLEVTQQDIDLGEPVDGRGCALARAARRLFPEADVQVDYEALLVEVGFDQDIYCLSRPAKNFICRFDGGLPVKPASFYAEKFT